MYEKNSSAWYLHEVARLSNGRLTPARVIGCSPPFQVHILVEEDDQEAIAATERLLPRVVETGSRVRLTSRHDYEQAAKRIRCAPVVG